MNVLETYLSGEDKQDESGLLGLLRSHGVHTVERVLSMEEKQLIELSGNRWDSQDVTFLKNYVAQRCATPAVNLSELYDHTKYFIHKVTSGCSAIDETIGGGFYTEEITELTGASACGKTQVCFSALASLLLSNEDAHVAYIDTTNSFSALRVKEILITRASGGNTEKKQIVDRALGRIHYYGVQTVPEFGEALANISEMEGKIAQLRLLVVDSVTSIFSPILGGKSSTLGYSAMLRSGQMLRAIGCRFGCAIIITNSTVGDSRGSNTRAALGNSWASVPSVRILLSRTNNSFEVRLLKSGRNKISGTSSQPSIFQITAGGISD